MKPKYNRHHVYSKRHRQYGTETKTVLISEHQAYHEISKDMHPVDALCYIIRNFLPTEFAPLMKEVKKYGEEKATPHLIIIKSVMDIDKAVIKHFERVQIEKGTEEAIKDLILAMLKSND